MCVYFDSTTQPNGRNAFQVPARPNVLTDTSVIEDNLQ